MGKWENWSDGMLESLVHVGKRAFNSRYIFDFDKFTEFVFGFFWRKKVKNELTS